MQAATRRQEFFYLSKKLVQRIRSIFYEIKIQIEIARRRTQLG